MIRKATLLLFFACFSMLCFSQNEASNWFFGENAGIKFNLINGTISNSTAGRINTIEGCASISDGNGNLLFYTDGTTVYNSAHNVMQNGNFLLGDASSTQSAIVVPKPGDANIYYVFTVGSNRNPTGLNYSTIDISQNGGLGAVISKNNNLLSNSSEKVTAVLKDCITKSIWVVTFASLDGFSNDFNTFHAFEVSDTGVSNTSVKSSFGAIIREARGYLKLSPDGTKVACANAREGLYIYDFDSSTGKVSNQKRLSINSNRGGIHPYGVEFSPNSELLYIHASNDFFDNQNTNLQNNPDQHFSTLVQFNLKATDVQSSQIIIDDRQLYRGGLQLGPDGKIYRTLSITYNQGSPYLGVIENPDALGLSCNYRHNAVNLSPNNSTQGLPPFIASFFNTQIDIIKNGKSNSSLALCEGDIYNLTSINLPGATYSWTKDNVPLPDTTYDLKINERGHYQVYINPNNGDCAIEGQAFVEFTPNPTANNHSLFQCDEDGIKDGLTIFNLHEADETITGNERNIKVSYYKDSNRTIRVNENAYQNSASKETLYVTVENILTGCTSFAELTIEVSVTDANDVILNPVCDDDGIEDGFHVFNLKDSESAMLLGLPSGLVVTYYETENEALLEQNPLNNIYTNTTPYSQTIYARVENNNNCYGISRIQLRVNNLPDIETEAVAYYCINKFPETINLDAGVINDSPSNYNYTWSTGETTYNIAVNNPGIYNVTVTNANGCSKNRSITLEASNIATFESIDIVDATKNNTVTVLLSGNGDYEYALFDSNNTLYQPYQKENIFENVGPGFYTISVKDIKNNCGTSEEKISVIGFPKYFTPNGDGYNDTWQVYGVSSMFQPNTKILIYDRYGKLVKEINPIGEGWNGTSRGQKLPADDYWFVVKLQDGRIYKNHFSLKN
ncbi:T9SS type B sorting domain-containing protein [Siansivirga zeaxanthinifaciens]|uniref:T9SS type B sorting domain-containing protein n=1 Tax=Siansivirga zeaxanthinifaciens CC-SAMT-1 TaxID=1454006 RepID=A0A0C5WEH4_9FLAO|nr:T9SS type B sorting domain-containing protein [Siansivirga zeaxanthinifaciens]AJR04627.1 hypothetical protein AW14_14270 [Siansivirga zeaxanthinifaciens CC-SAMT-1]